MKALLSILVLLISLFGEVNESIAQNFGDFLIPCEAYSESRIQSSFNKNHINSETGEVRDTVIISLVVSDSLSRTQLRHWCAENAFLVSDMNFPELPNGIGENRVVLKRKMEHNTVSYYSFLVSKFNDIRQTLKISDCGLVLLK